MLLTTGSGLSGNTVVALMFTDWLGCQMHLMYSSSCYHLMMMLLRLHDERLSTMLID